MSKHTPGPWSLNKYHEPVGPDGENIRAKGLALTNTPEALANSRLIAAAPDLLEIVRDVVSDSKGAVNPTFYDLAVAALAKAEGQP